MDNFLNLLKEIINMYRHLNTYNKKKCRRREANLQSSNYVPTITTLLPDPVAGCEFFSTGSIWPVRKNSKDSKSIFSTTVEKRMLVLGEGLGNFFSNFLELLIAQI